MLKKARSLPPHAPHRNKLVCSCTKLQFLKIYYCIHKTLQYPPLSDYNLFCSCCVCFLSVYCVYRQQWRWRKVRCLAGKLQPNRWRNGRRGRDWGAGAFRVREGEFMRANQHPYLDCRVLLEDGCVNSSPPVIKKEGVSVLRMNEQPDKLCREGLRGGREGGQTLLSLAC